jgi:hypothetical protein
MGQKLIREPDDNAQEKSAARRTAGMADQCPTSGCFIRISSPSIGTASQNPWRRPARPFQRRLPCAPDDIKWLNADRIFDLGDQPL